MGHPLLENKMNESKLGLEEEVRQGAGREGRWLMEWQAGAPEGESQGEERGAPNLLVGSLHNLSLVVIGALPPDLKGSAAPTPEWTVPSS